MLNRGFLRIAKTEVLGSNSVRINARLHTIACAVQCAFHKHRTELRASRNVPNVANGPGSYCFECFLIASRMLPCNDYFLNDPRLQLLVTVMINGLC